jgi:hypothetical protein
MYGGSAGIAPPFLTLALDGVKWTASRSCRFTPWENAPDVHCVGGWAGLRTSLGVVENRKMSCTCQESNPNSSTVQPIVRRYTD